MEVVGLAVFCEGGVVTHSGVFSGWLVGWVETHRVGSEDGSSSKYGM